MDPWYSPIQEELINTNLLKSCVLVDSRGECDCYLGSDTKLQDFLKDNTDAINLICSAFQQDTDEYSLSQEGKKIDWLGTTFHVCYVSSSCICAVSRRRMDGIIFNQLPFGTLVSYFSRPSTPHQLISKLYNICASFSK
mmetsp:Transcript_134/g.173  ORF Transcript_134/g.173 Transcript_134/m.173 type:complete len:139 (+) Transcript_134:124-540(+)